MIFANPSSCCFFLGLGVINPQLITIRYKPFIKCWASTAPDFRDCSYRAQTVEPDDWRKTCLIDSRHFPECSFACAHSRTRQRLSDPIKWFWSYQLLTAPITVALVIPYQLFVSDDRRGSGAIWVRSRVQSLWIILFRPLWRALASSSTLSVPLIASTADWNSCSPLAWIWSGLETPGVEWIMRIMASGRNLASPSGAICIVF